MKALVLFTIAVLTGALTGAVGAESPAAAPTTQQASVQSLRGADTATSDVAPDPMKGYSGKKPGLQKKIPRSFKTQPPLIPHAVDNFDEVTLEENQCLSCHGPEKYKEKNAPKVGDSHFKDRDGNKLAGASRARHACVMCHVPQVDAPPLVENTFSGK